MLLFLEIHSAQLLFICNLDLIMIVNFSVVVYVFEEDLGWLGVVHEL